MLDSMAGLVSGTRDALTRFTQPLTGSYYFVPSVESLLRLREGRRANLTVYGGRACPRSIATCSKLRARPRFLGL
jgi:hypothetical protein